MRSRNVKPGFFTNELLAEVSPLGRLLFIGLWCLADREGRLEDRPKRIKVEVLPFDDADVEELLEQLSQRGFIQRYEVDGTRLIQVTAFARHQSPHVREAPSVLPVPEHGSPAATPAPERPTEPPRQPRARSPEGQVPDGFEAFWQRYPRKVAKRDAQKAWSGLKPSEQLQGLIVQALDQASQSEQWQRDGGKFVPYAATWLRGRRWEDEYVPGAGETQPWKGGI